MTTRISDVKVGGAAVFSVTFRNAAQEIDDPDVVTFLWTLPDGTDGSWVYGTDPEVIKTATGKYVVALPITSPGRWAGGFRGESVDPLGVNAIDEACVCGVATSLVVV